MPKQLRLEVEYDPQLDTSLYFGFREDVVGDPNLKKKVAGFLPKELYKAYIEGVLSEESLKSFLTSFEKEQKETIVGVSTAFERIWKDNIEEITVELEELYQVELPFKDIKIYLVTLPIFPYHEEEGWFACGVFKTPEDSLVTCKHELNHFYFHRKFDEQTCGLVPDTYFKIKEAFSVLTLPEEEGYPGHEKLRAHIKGLQKEGKGVEEIFESSARFLGE